MIIDRFLRHNSHHRSLNLVDCKVNILHWLPPSFTPETLVIDWANFSEDLIIMLRELNPKNLKLMRLHVDNETLNLLPQIFTLDRLEYLTLHLDSSNAFLSNFGLVFETMINRIVSRSRPFTFGFFASQVVNNFYDYEDLIDFVDERANLFIYSRLRTSSLLTWVKVNFHVNFLVNLRDFNDDSSLFHNE